MALIAKTKEYSNYLREYAARTEDKETNVNPKVCASGYATAIDRFFDVEDILYTMCIDLENDKNKPAEFMERMELARLDYEKKYTALCYFDCGGNIFGDETYAVIKAFRKSYCSELAKREDLMEDGLNILSEYMDEKNMAEERKEIADLVRLIDSTSVSAEIKKGLTKIIKRFNELSDNESEYCYMINEVLDI